MRLHGNRRRFTRSGVGLCLLAAVAWSAFGLGGGGEVVPSRPSRYAEPYANPVPTATSIADLFPPGR